MEAPGLPALSRCEHNSTPGFVCQFSRNRFPHYIFFIFSSAPRAAAAVERGRLVLPKPAVRHGKEQLSQRFADFRAAQPQRRKLASADFQLCNRLGNRPAQARRKPAPQPRPHPLFAARATARKAFRRARPPVRTAACARRAHPPAARLRAFAPARSRRRARRYPSSGHPRPPARFLHSP